MIAPEAGLVSPSIASWDNSCRLWSLWDMIKVYATSYIDLGINIGQSASQYEVNAVFRRATGILGISAPNHMKHLDSTQQQKALETLKSLRAFCSTLDLPVSKHLLSDIEDKVPSTNTEFNIYINAIYAELNAKLFIYIPSYRAQFFEKEDIITDKAREAFPTAYGEIREAGNCFAAGRFTATVFHSMRAAEIGLRRLAEAVSITLPFPVELADWQNLIEKVEGEISKAIAATEINCQRRGATILFRSSYTLSVFQRRMEN